MKMGCEIIICLFLIAFNICTGEEQRILGGKNANIEDYPYQISMRWIYGVPAPFHFCGGSIISKNHIITAAHCVEDKRSPTMYPYIKIYTGTSRSDSAGNGKAYDVKRINIHPGYRGASNTYLNDIAIVTLKESIEFNESQKPVKLPSKNVWTGAKAVITGWGNTDRRGGKTPVNLQKASMNLLASSECNRYLPYPLKDSQVCAIHSAGVGVCSGDSGGPLVVDGEIVGVTSYVIECGKGYPDVYTNVYSFNDFIKQIINSGNNNNASSCTS